MRKGKGSPAGAKLDRSTAVRLGALAARGEREGDDSPSWDRWLACAGDDAQAALETLSENEALWLSAWCFAKGHADLGLLAYERVLASKAELGDGSDGDVGGVVRVRLNYFRTFVYVGHALRLGGQASARAALGAARAKCGLDPSGEVLFAALQFLGGELGRAATAKMVARFAQSSNDVTQAARAVAFDVLGEEEGVAQILARWDRDTVFMPAIQHVLRERFGDAFTSAMARSPHPPPPKAKLVPGLVAKVSKKKSIHLFAPPLQPGAPLCRGCKRPLRTWFSFELASVPLLAPQLGAWKRFDTPACFDCAAWMVRHDFRMGPRGSIVLEDAEPLAKNASVPRADHSSRIIATQFASLVKAPRDLAERPLDGDLQVGGAPAWVQDAVPMACREGHGAMVFVFRLSAPNDFAECPEPAGGSGALYFFACPRPKCRRFASIAQCT